MYFSAEKGGGGGVGFLFKLSLKTRCQKLLRQNCKPNKTFKQMVFQKFVFIYNASNPSIN